MSGDLLKSLGTPGALLAAAWQLGGAALTYFSKVTPAQQPVVPAAVPAQTIDLATHALATSEFNQRLDASAKEKASLKHENASLQRRVRVLVAVAATEALALGVFAYAAYRG